MECANPPSWIPLLSKNLMMSAVVESSDFRSWDKNSNVEFGTTYVGTKIIRYPCFGWSPLYTRYAWAGGTFFPFVLLFQFFVLVGNRFWFYILLTYVLRHCLYAEKNFGVGKTLDFPDPFFGKNSELGSCCQLCLSRKKFRVDKAKNIRHKTSDLHPSNLFYIW